MTDFAIKASDLDPCYAAFKKQFPEYDRSSDYWTFWREGYESGKQFAQHEPIPGFGWFSFK